MRPKAVLQLPGVGNTRLIALPMVGVEKKVSQNAHLQ